MNLAAFATSIEADLVDALRRQATPILSLVAEDDANIIGHILFSPVTLASDPELILMRLAAVAVAPSRQRQSVGATLVREGRERCRQRKVAAVVVVVHPEYYHASASGRRFVCRFAAITTCPTTTDTEIRHAAVPVSIAPG